MEYEPLKDSVEPRRLIDLGSLMLTFTILWAYVSFSQFLIIWSGNLKNEIPWYMARAFGSWAVIAVILLIFHFFVPFFLLLQRQIKRRVRTLSMVAGILLTLTLIDVYWLVVPAYEPSGPRLHLTDIFAVVGIGGLWFGMFLGELREAAAVAAARPAIRRGKSSDGASAWRLSSPMARASRPIAARDTSNETRTLGACWSLPSGWRLCWWSRFLP